MHTSYTVHIGVLSIELMIFQALSLKDKRMILNAVKDKLKNKFNVSVSELGELDKWQKSIIGIVMISNDKSYLDSALQKVLSFVEQERDVQVSDYQLEFL